MLKKIIILTLATFSVVSFYGQDDLQKVLQAVELNNLSLKAAMHRTDAMTLESKASNNLEDPEVTYHYLWGNRSELGTSGELIATQSFDFPSVYVRRNRMNNALAQQFSNEYLAQRQQILLEAKNTWLALQSNLREGELIEIMLENTEGLKESYRTRFEAGDIGSIELQTVEYQSMSIRQAEAGNSARRAELMATLKALNGGEEIEIKLGDNSVNRTLRPFEEVLESYLSSDPSLMSLRNNQQASAQAVKLSSSQSLPKLTLGYRLNHGKDERFSGIATGITIPLFSSRSTVKQAKANEQAAINMTQSAETECRTSLEALYNQAASYRLTIEQTAGGQSDKKFVADLQKALDEGGISVVDYFIMLNSYLEAAQSRLSMELEYDLIAARINMIYL